MLIPISIFAQTGDDSLGFDIMNLFTSFATFGAGVLVITGVISKYLLKNLSALGRSIASWIVALIIGYVGWFLNLGIFADIEWWNVLIIVISFATGANVIYNIDWLRKLLEQIKVAPKKSTNI